MASTQRRLIIKRLSMAGTHRDALIIERLSVTCRAVPSRGFLLPPGFSFRLVLTVSLDGSVNE